MEDFSPPDFLREFHAWLEGELKDLHARIDAMMHPAPLPPVGTPDAAPDAAPDAQENAGGSGA